MLTNIKHKNGITCAVDSANVHNACASMENRGKGCFHTWQNTKELNMNVLRMESASELVSFRSCSPLSWKIKRTRIWKMLCPTIFLHMILVMNFTSLPTGGLFINPSCGGSVASAKAPRVSMIKFTQSICTVVRGVEPEIYFKRFISHMHWMKT